MINYWWVTRPKRKLNSVPSVLTIFAEESLNQVWNGARNTHLSFENALEKMGMKREGDRRDHTGGGARTYKAWMKSLGLIFSQKGTKLTKLTLAGEALLQGVSPVKVLGEQVLKYQFPSSFSMGRSIRVNERFRIHPFWFLLRLLMDGRIQYLKQDEMAKIVITEAERETDKCFEYIVSRILEYRECGDKVLSKDFFKLYGPSKGGINLQNPYGNLMDVANTLMNWLEYTQLVYREGGKMMVIEEERDHIQNIINHPFPFIERPDEEEFFQRKYGLDPDHRKDTRNLNDSSTITNSVIMERIIGNAFVQLSLKKPIASINTSVIDEISEKTGADNHEVEDILLALYPHGSIGAFLSNYFEMAFKSRENCIDFEKATTDIFREVFGFNATHLGSQGANEVPDVLLVSDQAGYQAIIDTKAYSAYSLPATQRDRMIYHYIPDIKEYSHFDKPLAFFSYISGGFSNNFDEPLNKIIDATGVNGSGITVSNFIKMVEHHEKAPYTHERVKDIFGLNRKIRLNDLQ